MSAKIAKTIHLSAAQWRILRTLMRNLIDVSDDPSVRRVAEFVEKAATS